MTLIEFLLARIAEDEVVARACPRTEMRIGTIDRRGDHALVAHVARWEPTRVLAECESKRLIVAAHPRCTAGDHCVCECEWGSPDSAPCLTLAALALPYVDHPAYREATA